MKNKKIILMLLIAIFQFTLIGCGNDSSENVTKLSFKSAASYDYLKTLDGEKIQINGYMATSSPVDGSFIFLMNLPYQSCPFCVPNTSQLSNTIEVYPKKNNKFTYTTNAIKVIGKLMVSPNKDEPFTDDYEYQFNFKLVDAEYYILSDDELSNNVKVYQKLANSNIVNDIYEMYDYVNFCCNWPTYFVNSYKNEKGELVSGYYLYASDAKKLIFENNGQYHYGYKDGYFKSLIKRLKEISDNDFKNIIDNISKAQELANYAISELESGNYAYEYIYVEKFNKSDYVYSLNDKTLANQFDNLYYEFSDWLSEFEM